MPDIDAARLEINEIDRQMAALFSARMDAVRQIAGYKREHGMSVTDPKREEEIIVKNAALIENGEYRGYYISFLRYNMELSKDFQRKLLGNISTSENG